MGTSMWRDSNRYYKELAYLLDDALRSEIWRSLVLNFDVYEPDEVGNVFTTVELSVNLMGGVKSIRAPSETYDILESLRESMMKETGGQWSSVIFSMTSDGEIDVKFGYEKLVYDPEKDDFYD